MEKTYYDVESLVLIFAEDDGKLKIYLKKREEEPYKSYWTIPTESLNENMTLEENAAKVYKDMTNLSAKDIKQAQVFSTLNRNPKTRTIGVSFISITDKTVIDMKQEGKDKEWFDIDELPKLAFDHETIIKTLTDSIRKKTLTNYDDILLEFFQSDFTLLELHTFYENVSGKSIDKRNFHKKLMNQHLLVDTGFKSAQGSGRPGKLYRFNVEKMKGKRL